MFVASIQKEDDKQARHNISVYVDTLHEAEICITAFISRVCDSRHIVIVHEHDLIYYVYDDGMLIGLLAIRMIN